MSEFIIGFFALVLVPATFLFRSDVRVLNDSTVGPIIFIGQDNDSIADYAVALGVKDSLSGVSAYVDMDLNGLVNDEFNGSGNNNISSLVQTYPNAAILVAVKAQNKLLEINRGVFDKKIDVLLETLISFDRTVYLRFGYEFDGPWNQYDPEEFKSAWKRLAIKLKRLEHSRKIRLVWHSSSQCHLGKVNTHKNYPFSMWYPGDEFVDDIAISYFTPGSQSDTKLRGGTCKMPNEAIDAVARFARERKKPLLIAEATPQGYSIKDLTWRHRYGGDQAVTQKATEAEVMIWYERFFEWIYANNVKVVTYINTDWNSQAMYTLPNTTDYWGSSRIQDNLLIKKLWLKYTSKKNIEVDNDSEN